MHHNLKLKGYYNISDKLVELTPDYFVRVEIASDITEFEEEKYYKNNIVNNSYECCKEGVTKEMDSLQNLPQNLIDLRLKKFKNQGIFYISSLNNDLEIDEDNYKILSSQGMESLIAAPLIDKGVITGFIGVDDSQEHHMTFLFYHPLHIIL